MSKLWFGVILWWFWVVVLCSGSLCFFLSGFGLSGLSGLLGLLLRGSGSLCVEMEGLGGFSYS